MHESEESIRLDQEIANRLQNEHPEQYITLVRMHLSFELDLNTDTENDPANIDKAKHKLWKGFHKKAKSCATKSNSPETAKTFLTKQNIRDVKQLISFLEQDQNISQEGIFRKTGSLSRQNELKNALVHGVSISLENGDYTAHDCASVLKSFLADLSEPLLTELYYPAYCQVAELCHSKDSLSVREERLRNVIQLLFLLLPKENNLLLRCIIDLLHKTIQHEATNKMSADNLATLFTPHLICPRKLSPEALRTTAAQMCSIVSFMIKNGSRLFCIPPKLATDIRAFFVERKRRKTMSPEHILNESITSDSVANTVYTFVDREKTAEALVMNSTDTALAQLYAHIQSLPESSKKKKLIKQFNRENGHGTPLTMHREKNSNESGTKTSKSIGDSIKRHIFHKTLMSKTPKHSNTPMSFQHTPNGTVLNVPKQRVLFQSPMSSATNSPCVLGKRSSTTSTSSSEGRITPCLVTRSSSSISATSAGSYRCDYKQTSSISDVTGLENTGVKRYRMNDLDEDDPPPPEDDEDFVEQEGDDIGDEENSSDNLLDAGRTLSDHEEDRYCSTESGSGLSDSRSKYKSEPNLSTVHEETHERAANIKERKMSFLKNKLIKGVSMGNLRLPFTQEQRATKKSTASLLKCCFEENLKHAKKSMDDCSSGSIPSISSPDCRLVKIFGRARAANNEEYDHNNMMNENNANVDLNSWNMNCLTSTPALNGRNSMSPITKSTQRMPKSMQESIMTPRSRKPVMLLGGMNTIDQQHSTYASQGSFCSLQEEDEDEPEKDYIPETNNYLPDINHSQQEVKGKLNNSEAPNCAVDNRPISTTSATSYSAVEQNNISNGQGAVDVSGSLTSTFRDYLLSRSVSPVDLSFASQADDYNSSDDLNNLSESGMSNSLLYCMNGNRPPDVDSESTLVNVQKCYQVDSRTGITASKNCSLSSQIPQSDTELDETSL